MEHQNDGKGASGVKYNTTEKNESEQHRTKGQRATSNLSKGGGSDDIERLYRVRSEWNTTFGRYFTRPYKKFHFSDSLLEGRVSSLQ